MVRMKQLFLVLAVTTTSLAAGATETAPSFGVFQEVANRPVSSDAKWAVGQLMEHCSYEIMSRRGPDPAQVAQCEKAVRAVSLRGKSAAPAIFAALDSDDTSWPARERLYDALARTRDTTLIEPLVRGMERVVGQPDEDRLYETDNMQRVISRLAFVVKDPMPGGNGQAIDQRETAKRRVAEWRAWQAVNGQKPSSVLRAEAMLKARQDLKSPDDETAYRAAYFLLQASEKEGIAGGRALLARPSLPDEARWEIEFQIEAAERRLPQAAPAVQKVEPPSPKPQPTKAPELKNPFQKKAPALSLKPRSTPSRSS